MNEILLPLLIAAVIFWVLSRRLRRLFGRHRVSIPRAVLRVGLAGTVAVLLTLLPTSPVVLRILGVVIGAALAVGGVMTAGLNRSEGAWFCEPNPVFGSLVAALLLGRIVYRLLALGGLSTLMDGTSAGGAISFGDPAGRLLLLVAATYFAGYNAGILVRMGSRNQTGATG